MDILKGIVNKIFYMIAVSLNRLAGICMLGIGFFTLYLICWFHISSYVLILVLGSLMILLSLFIHYQRTDISGLNIIKDAHIHWAFICIITLGVVLRIGWVSLVPPIQLSDYRSYLEAARRLLEERSYYYVLGDHILYAWRPPGYPFFLAACIALFGDLPYIPTITNIIFYILTSIVVYKIVVSLSGKGAGLFAMSILALWPSYIAITGLAASEPLSLLLFTTAFWTFFLANESPTTRYSCLYAIVTGLLTGYGALARPSLLAVPFLWILYLLMLKKDRGVKLRNTVIAIISMVIMICPWTLRNYDRLGGFLLISSNGGDVFYRANNPMATGFFKRTGERDLSVYLHDEILWSQKGMEWGKEWIKQHPVDFMKLAIKKQGWLLGEDTSGVYWTLQRGHNLGGRVYTFFIILSNMWWIFIWMLVICGTLNTWYYLTHKASGGLLAWMTLFFVVVHSVFESHSRYHLPMIGLLAVLSALAFSRTPEFLRASDEIR